VSTRKVDDLVRALGADTGISKSEVSRICADLDTEVAAFRDRSLAEMAFLTTLRAAAEELADRSLDELCDRLIDRLVDRTPDDDVALVAIRLHRQDRPRPADAGPRRTPPTVPSPPSVSSTEKPDQTAVIQRRPQRQPTGVCADVSARPNSGSLVLQGHPSSRCRRAAASSLRVGFGQAP
jgi:hypothetical protein